MIEKLYSEFDPDLSIRVKEGKSFNENRIDTTSITKLSEVNAIAFALEEEVILKHEDKWTNASLLGVDPSFLKIAEMDSHMVEGLPSLNEKGESYALIGASLLDKLDGFIPVNVGHESLIFYAPKRQIKFGLGRNPFYMKMFKLNGRYNYNREVNASTVILPIDEVRRFINQANRASVLFVDVKEKKLSSTKEAVQQIVGKDFEVKTNFEKNELIFKTSKSEKLVVILILAFIFILAAFNLVASLIMLYVEKKNDVRTLSNMGASRSLLFKIFFFEGLLIAGKGILIGGVLGYAICAVQLNWGLLTMPNTGGEVFPIALSFKDGLFIFSLVSVLSLIFSYLPVRYLLRTNANLSSINQD